jgi:hypothetical protein
MRPQVHTLKLNLSRDLRNQKNLELHPSGTYRTQVHLDRSMGEGLDHSLGMHQYSWIWFFGYSGGNNFPDQVSWIGWMCDVQLSSWKECDFGDHKMCRVHSQKPGMLSFGLGRLPFGHQSRAYMDLLQSRGIWKFSGRRTARDGQNKSHLSHLCVGNWRNLPAPATSFPNSLILLCIVSIWVRTRLNQLLYKTSLTI